MRNYNFTFTTAEINPHPRLLDQIIWSRISIGHPVRFYRRSTRILEVWFKCLRIANFIEKCNKNANWTSSKISIGRLLESTGHLVELLYWMSTRTEDLADCFITFSSPLCHAKYKKTGDVYPWIKPLMMLKIILIILTHTTTMCVYISYQLESAHSYFKHTALHIFPNSHFLMDNFLPLR